MASATRTQRSTKLSYTPNRLGIISKKRGSWQGGRIMNNELRIANGELGMFRSVLLEFSAGDLVDIGRQGGYIYGNRPQGFVLAVLGCYDLPFGLLL